MGKAKRLETVRESDLDGLAPLVPVVIEPVAPLAPVVVEAVKLPDGWTMTDDTANALATADSSYVTTRGLVTDAVAAFMVENGVADRYKPSDSRRELNAILYSLLPGISSDPAGQNAIRQAARRYLMATWKASNVVMPDPKRRGPKVPVTVAGTPVPEASEDAIVASLVDSGKVGQFGKDGSLARAMIRLIRAGDCDKSTFDSACALIKWDDDIASIV